MKKLFYVEPSQMLRIGLKSVFSGDDWEIYTLDSMDDFDFRIKDFAPDILLLDGSFYNNGNLEKIRASVTQIPVGFMSKEPVASSDDYFFIKKPISLSEIKEVVENFLK